MQYISYTSSFSTIFLAFPYELFQFSYIFFIIILNLILVLYRITKLFYTFPLFICVKMCFFCAPENKNKRFCYYGEWSSTTSVTNDGFIIVTSCWKTQWKSFLFNFMLFCYLFFKCHLLALVHPETKSTLILNERLSNT